MIRIVLPLVILALGIGCGVWFVTNPDEAKKRPVPEAKALLVETGKPDYGSYPAFVEAMGQVRPALEVGLKSQVSGEIITAGDEFIPGGFFHEGDIILEIDPSDYELAVKKQKAVLRQAQAEYDLEMGRQSVAQDELKILERTTGRKPESPDLALRKPQLAQAQAELDKARSDLEAAQLDLQRTSITAPFNALVKTREATQGDKISGGEMLATLVSTDEYWLTLSVPVTDLQWLEIPRRKGDPGSPARIVLDGGRGERQGHLLRLTGSLDQQSRLATLLVSVSDPLLLNGSDTDKPALILGDYARIVLEGRQLEKIVRIPVSWVRDGQIVWVRDNGRLAFRPVRMAYVDRVYAYIREGLSADDEIVISDIAVPVENMKIRTVDEARTDVMEKMKGPKGQE